MSRPPEVPPEPRAAEPAPGQDLVPVAPPPPAEAPPTPGVLDLVSRSARVGLDAAGLLVTEVAEATVRAARAVLPPVVARGPLDSVEERVDRRRDEVRRRDAVRRDEAAEAMQAVIGRVVELVLDQIDMSTLIQRIPIDEVVDNIDIEAIIDKIDIKAIVDRIDIEDIVAGVDIGAIVRDSTTGLAGETVDAVRVQVMGIDLWAARVIDRILRRKTSRDLALDGYDVYGPEVRTPKELR